jgi:hypothetical protein
MWLHGSGPNAGENNVFVDIDDGLKASREGRVLCRWINDKVPGASQVVLTDGPTGDQPGIYYNLEEGERLLVTQLCMELTTFSDDVTFELGWTTAINGGGTFTPSSPARVYKTGAASRGFDGFVFDADPPISFNYSDGVRSVTYRVNCNDAAATITPGRHGWTEDE